MSHVAVTGIGNFFPGHTCSTQLISDDDIANSILFLISSAASMITAQSLIIVGGYGCDI
ncbi:MAG: hypothetical protein ACJA0N_001784 [Pseudohongiellaceae bacterium]|jgi:hypothetical protein